MFQPLDPQAVTQALQRLAGSRLYLHFEFTRGGFLRNLVADVEEAVLRGEGPYRVALRCREHGWVIMEGLTQMALSPDLLVLGALDEEQKLAHLIQLSREAYRP